MIEVLPVQGDKRVSVERFPCVRVDQREEIRPEVGQKLKLEVWFITGRRITEETTGELFLVYQNFSC